MSLVRVLLPLDYRRLSPRFLYPPPKKTNHRTPGTPQFLPKNPPTQTLPTNTPLGVGKSGPFFFWKKTGFFCSHGRYPPLGQGVPQLHIYTLGPRPQCLKWTPARSAMDSRTRQALGHRVRSHWVYHVEISLVQNVQKPQSAAHTLLRTPPSCSAASVCSQSHK